MPIRQRALRPLALCLLGLVWAAAHTLAHGLVQHHHGSGSHHHHEHGAGGYVAYLPTSVALCLTLAVGIATIMALGGRRVGASFVSLWLFGFVPVLGFAGHSLGSALGQGTPGGLPAVPASALLLGLVIQLPFALVAVAIGGTILVLAERLATTLGRPLMDGVQAALASFSALPARSPRAWLALRANRPRAPPVALAS